MSEKVALAVSYTAAFITGFIIAYSRCWRLALALSSIIPCMAVSGGVLNKLLAKSAQFVFFPSLLSSPPHPPRRLSRKHVADGGTLAEEVISSVRTAHAFGTQKILSSLYDVHIQQARVVEAKTTIFHGAALGLFLFFIYAAYALGTESRR